MSTDPSPRPTSAEHLEAALRARRAELAEAPGVRIGRSAVVHEQTTRTWVGITVPAVVCRSVDDPLRLRPAWEPVSCRRCRTRGRSAETPQVPGQQSLPGW